MALQSCENLKIYRGLYGEGAGEGGGGGGRGGGGQSQCARTIQTSVNFRDFEELSLHQLSKNHFQAWEFYYF